MRRLIAIEALAWQDRPNLCDSVDGGADRRTAETRPTITADRASHPDSQIFAAIRRQRKVIEFNGWAVG
jgi:hypothetical protein